MPKKPTLILGLDLTIIAIFIGVALLPWEQFVTNRVNLTNILAPISLQHPLGTDNLGRDLVTRIHLAITDTVLPLWILVLVSCLGGGAVAVANLVLRGRYVIVRFVGLLIDLMAIIVVSIPVGILVFYYTLSFERAGFLPVALALSVIFAFRTYFEVINLFKESSALGYWQAHQALGGSLWYRVLRYGILGSWKWSLLNSLSFNLTVVVTIEASLSYLGFGIQEPVASFGNMLASHFDIYLKGQMELLIILIGAISLTATFPISLVNSLKRLGA